MTVTQRPFSQSGGATIDFNGVPGCSAQALAYASVTDWISANNGVGKAAGDDEFAASGSSGDRCGPGIALAARRVCRIVDVLTDFTGDPSGEPVPRPQLGLILDQIEGIEVWTDAERQAVDLLRRAASIARRANGYLLFVGD
ncbi:hypothetical protein ACW9HC_31630 [Nocardia gipuzkoensis]